MAREIDDNSPFVPIVLTEKQAVAALAAVRSVFMSGSLFAESDEDKERIKPLAGAMLRMAKAIDKARGQEAES
jgi:hypothetical protein